MPESSASNDPAATTVRCVMTDWQSVVAAWTTDPRPRVGWLVWLNRAKLFDQSGRRPMIIVNGGSTDYAIMKQVHQIKVGRLDHQIATLTAGVSFADVRTKEA